LCAASGKPGSAARTSPVSSAITSQSKPTSASDVFMRRPPRSILRASTLQPAESRHPLTFGTHAAPPRWTPCPDLRARASNVLCPDPCTGNRRCRPKPPAIARLVSGGTADPGGTTACSAAGHDDRCEPSRCGGDLGSSGRQRWHPAQTTSAPRGVGQEPPRMAGRSVPAQVLLRAAAQALGPPCPILSRTSLTASRHRRAVSSMARLFPHLSQSPVSGADAVQGDEGGE
jgi:hypothetical protein